jgi:hypothetical protein
MFKFIIVAAAVAAAVWVFVQSLPDIERYMRLRSM